MPGPLVSIVIPAYNPTGFLLEAIASASAQTYPHTEIILVNDGSDKLESTAILERASRLVKTYIEQPNRGPAVARNTGIRAAQGEYIVPLDADDLLEAAYVAECLGTLCDSDAAFAYTDFNVFGTERYLEKPGEYNLYRLLDRNYLAYAALIRMRDWEMAGGYDEAGECIGYEDWEFWLRLGARNRFGQYLPKSLLRYRKHGPSVYTAARTRHGELLAYIRGRHPELYDYENRARIKARWSPAVSIITVDPPTNQTIADIQMIAPGQSPASGVVLDAVEAPLDPQAAELAALANWSGHMPSAPAASPGGRLHRHLLNAELLSLRSWTHHPLRSTARLIPLRMKEQINRLAGRPILDLSFYLQFRPNSVLMGDAIVEPLVYFPKPARGRKRVALVNPHLGPGGAESVLYDIASTICSDAFETLLLATHSRDDRWMTKWRERVDHVYDLERVISPEMMTAGLCSVVSNWRCDYLVIQNSLYGYGALPLVKKLLPGIKIIDVIHSLDGTWDQIAATADVAAHIDVRVAMSETVQSRLPGALLIRNGVDLARFSPVPLRPDPTKTILFAGRLNPVKRPVFLADIAHELTTLRPQRDFRFLIAGDGPEEGRFRQRVHKLGLNSIFDFRGQVDDLAPLLTGCELLLVPSRSEGVPLVVLEALASARPVVASKTGSIPEVLDSSCGVLIEQIDSASEFARAIQSLLEQPELCAKMGVEGRRRVVAKHDIRKTREAFARIFDQGSSVSVSSTSRSTAME
jgi:glycosyltransferase involved in cell wall biosynthesis